MKIKQSDEEHLIIVAFPWFGFFFALLVMTVSIWVCVTGRLAGESWFVHVICWIFIGIATVAVICFGAKKTFDFDFRRREMVWTRKTLFGTKEGNLPFDEIQEASVEKSYNSEGGCTYRPVLRTVNGVFPLQGYYTGSQLYQKIVDAINTALKIELATSAAADNMDDQILDLIAKGNKINAIKLVRQHYGYSLVQAKDFVEELAKRV